MYKDVLPENPYEPPEAAGAVQKLADGVVVRQRSALRIVVAVFIVLGAVPASLIAFTHTCYAVYQHTPRVIPGTTSEHTGATLGWIIGPLAGLAVFGLFLVLVAYILRRRYYRPRLWTTAEGTSFMATCVSFDQTKVVLMYEDGTVSPMLREKLSETDRLWLDWEA